MKSALEKFTCITPDSPSYSRYNSDVEQQKTYVIQDTILTDYTVHNS
jgi:hypothetical protein